ncbi:MAG: hypothetical protein WCD20_16845 [Rhodomicrobium sp.]
MNFRSSALVTAAFLAGLVSNSPALQSQEADVNAYIVKAPIAGIPSGPFSKWTEPQREMVFERVRGFCQFLCVDKYNGETFSSREAAERTAAEAKVCLGACIAAHLPPDYPRYADLTKELHADYDQAKRLGSKLPWPLPAK